MTKQKKMDISNKMPVLALVIVFSICVSAAADVPQVHKLTVNILDGEAIVFWNQPTDAPSNIKYNVQMAKHNGEWAIVASCTRIQRTFCHVSSLIDDYVTGYKVRVQAVANNEESEWTAKKFLPNQSELEAPSFTLWATSSTLTVHVHQKPILKKLFPFGLTYTIYLEQRGQDNKNTTAYIRDGVEDDQRNKTFRSLQWGTEYCISIRVEGNGALSKSSVSHRKCLVLPEQEWFIIAVSSLSTVGVFTVIVIVAIILLCYLKRPEKTPTALKSPAHGWYPLTVGEGTIEVVTDKGWLLSSYRTEVKNCVAKDPTALHVSETEDKEEDRRTSMDSGVSMVSNPPPKKERSSMGQEDSGCGSMGGPDSSFSSQTHYPLQNERTDDDAVWKKEDSGVRLNCQLDSSSVNTEGQDSGSLEEFVAGGNYRSQMPSSVQIHVCNDERVLKQIIPDSVLVEVVTGFRAWPQSCICSGAGRCTWCHKQGLHENEQIKQYRAICVQNGLPSDISMDSLKEELRLSGYPRKSQMDTVMLSDSEGMFI